MGDYLKAAFLVGVDVPALGRLPVIVLLAIAFAILGFAQPAFWLVGVAVVVSIVSALAFNPRFQKYVQGQRLQGAKDDDESKRRSLFATLTPDAQQKMASISEKCNRVLDVYRSQQAESYIIDSNREALDRLKWLYLKLLVARHHLLTSENNESVSDLQKRVRDLETDLQQQTSQPESLRESKTATVSILKKRLANIQRRKQTLEEIDSDCTRIESQVDLLLENASMEGKPQTISSDIELASSLLGSGIFGDDEQAVSHLDRKYSSSASQQVSQ